MSKEKSMLCFILADHAEGLGKAQLEYILSELESELSSTKIKHYNFIHCEAARVSFELVRDLLALEREGLIYFENEMLTFDRKRVLEIAYTLTYEEQKVIRLLVNKIVASGHKDRSNPFLNHVCKIRDAIFTSGYEGENIDFFLAKLKRNSITKLVDVRSNPISRKYGFSKKLLSEFAARVGIAYEHFPALGIPSESRKKLKNKDDYEALFEDYKKTILATTDLEQEALAKAIQNENAVLVCFEAAYKQCHRSHLAAAISLKTGKRVIHL